MANKLKDLIKGIAVATILTIPYLAMNNIDSQIYNAREGQREYIECAGIRKIENRRNFLESQDKFFEKYFKD